MMNIMLRPRTVLAALALAALFSIANIRAAGQSTETQLSMRLIDKSFIIIGLWDSDKLKFDAQGHPAGHYKTVPFTLSGMHVDKISLHGSHLKLEGEREGILFDKHGTMTRITMMVGYRQDMKPEKMSIEIDNGNSRDFGPALDAIFTEDPAQLASQLPDFWQRYFKQNFRAQASQSALPSDTTSQPARQQRVPLPPGVTRVGGSVRAPRLLHNAEPEYSEDARRMKISGNVMVYLVVDENGDPQQVSVERPAGMGLDEKAVSAVRQYKFQPATQNDKPVKVELHIDVNFQIF